jgi:hypothetical protein
MTPRSEPKSGRERRAQPRFRVNHPALLKSEASGVAAVRVLDVGRFGVRVAVPFRLPIRDQVEVRIENTPVCGVVRNCFCKGGYEFHIGIGIGESTLDHLPILQRAISLNRGLSSPSTTRAMTAR